MAIGKITSKALAAAAAMPPSGGTFTGDVIFQGNINGAYSLPTSDGTANQVLTTDGSGTITFADAGGGGGGDPDLYRDSASGATDPTATGTNSVAIGSDAQATSNNGSIAFGTQTRATANANAAMGFQANAGGVGALAVGYTSHAASSWSTALGYNAKTATGSSATALTKSYASGADSLAAAITNSTASYGALGANSIAIGYQAKAEGGTNGSVAIGYNAHATTREAVAIGSSAYADGSGSVALGGYFGTSVQARATGAASFAVAGYNGLANRDSTAAGLSSIALAGGYAQQSQSVAIGAFAHANVRGKVAWSSYPLTYVNGVTQAGNYVLSNSTTDATATVLVTDYEWATPSTINQVVLPNNSCYGFTGTVIARENSIATNDFAVWEIKGGAVRAASASTTALGTYNINKISESAGAANWSIALSADTTNGAVAITVTGEASHSIRWVATVNTTEVIY